MNLLKPAPRHGFTLVEMAIVLVIVGLLAGGVLVGQDLMKAAEIRSTVNTLNRITTGAGAFRLKYHNLPGDMQSSKAAQWGFIARSGLVGHGDGNGIIAGCSNSGIALGCETSLFWRDLTQAMMINARLTGVTADGLVDGTAAGFQLVNYLPKLPLRDNVYISIYPLQSLNMYFLSAITSVTAAGVVNDAPGLTTFEAYAIDQKFDDEVPDTGIVRSMSDFMTEDNGQAAGPTTCAVNTTPMTYNTAPQYHDSIACRLSIRSGL